jgi:hypothetical protein
MEETSHVAKPRVGPHGYKLVVHFERPVSGWNGGLLFQYEAPSGRLVPGVDGIQQAGSVVTWEQWDNLVQWVDQRRAEAAERLRSEHEKQMTALENR